MADTSRLDIVRGAILGAVTGDALGVPVEFRPRGSLKATPVTDMMGYGTYSQPAGTWSDDSSMTLCLLESLCGGLDYRDQMERFSRWINRAYMTPHDEVFDVGGTTRAAIRRFDRGADPLSCGSTGENENGNGSLMRIMPLALWLCFKGADGAEFFDTIHRASSLTHAHPISLTCCGVYCAVVRELLRGGTLDECVKRGVDAAISYYKNSEYAAQLGIFDRISRENFASLDESEIGSSGYVLDTLEASLWCLLTTGSYRECVLKAVNLGGDTDTTADVVGGLAGLWYGVKSIPGEWTAALARLDVIEALCRRFAESVGA